MQKMIALILAVMLTLGLAACGETEVAPRSGERNTLWDSNDALDNHNNGTGGNGSPRYDDGMATGGGTAGAGGDSYEQMLENGRVHDTDGILTDGENSQS